jgi:hypothetical protein
MQGQSRRGGVAHRMALKAQKRNYQRRKGK